MKTSKQKRFGSVQLTPVEHAKKRVTRYLRHHPDGLSTGQLNAWIDSVRRGGVIRLPDFQQGLRELSADGIAVCTAGLWWLRKERPRVEPAPPIDSRDLPKTGLFAEKTGGETGD